MDSTAHEKKAFDWGIVGVDLDDIEVPAAESNPDETAVHVDRDPQAFVIPFDSDFASAEPSPINPSNELISIFDRFPEAFVSDSDERAEGLGSYLPLETNDNTSIPGHMQFPRPLAVEKNGLPYSWMVKNPGQTAKNLCRNPPRPRNIDARPVNKLPGNVEGEMKMEEQFKRLWQDPYDYFFRAAAFSCIMELNSQGLLHPTILATLIGRLFNGEAGFLDVFNRFFMPSGLRIEFTTGRARVHDLLLQAGRHSEANPTNAYHPLFRSLIKVMHHLAYDRVSEGIHMDEIVGRLVYSSSGLEVRPDPGAYTILRGARLSHLFLSRRGEWWPYKRFPWQEADLLGLYNTRKANRKDTTATLDPRRLVVRGENRAWA